MDSWKEYILEDVIDKFIDYRGKTPKKTQNGVPLVTAKIVKKGRILTPTEFIAIEDYESWMTRGLPKINDIVLTTEAPLGEIALVKDDKVALAQRIITLRGKVDKVHNPFLKYYFQSNIGQYKLKSRASGSTVSGIKSSVLKKIPVDLPPLPEQKAIAEVLSSLDDKIDLLHRQNKTLEAMAETLFRQWFVEEADESWEEPSSYTTLTLNELIEINPKEYLKKGAQATYLEMKNVRSNSSCPELWYSREYTSGTKFRNGDTIMARITPCLQNGKRAFVQFLKNDEIGWGSTEFLIFRTKEPYHPFVSYLLASNGAFKAFAEKSMTGSSGRQRVQTNSLWNFDLKKPPNDKIVELNSIFEVLSTKIHLNHNQIQTLTKLRDTLLPKLMSGEVRVKMNIDNGTI